MRTSILLTNPTEYDNMGIESARFDSTVIFCWKQVNQSQRSIIGRLKWVLSRVHSLLRQEIAVLNLAVPMNVGQYPFLFPKMNRQNSLRKAIVRELAQHVRQSMAVLGIFPSRQLVKQTVTLSQFEERFKALSQRDKVTVFIFVLVFSEG